MMPAVSGGDSKKPELGSEEFVRLSRAVRDRAERRGWTPPSEEEFNRDWILPEDTIAGPVHRLGGGTERLAVMEQLKAGVLVAVARTAQICRGGAETIVRFAHIPPTEWRGLSSEAEHLFWDQNTLVVEDLGTTGYGSGPTQRYFGIRFDPRDGYLDPTPSVQPANAIQAVARGSDLSRDEAERFSRAILAGWPGSTRAFAHEKALLFFPEHKVPRDWFYDIFSLIRGPKNPGPQPKRRD
jgi:hypothetical protein